MVSDATAFLLYFFDIFMLLLYSVARLVFFLRIDLFMVFFLFMIKILCRRYFIMDSKSMPLKNYLGKIFPEEFNVNRVKDEINGGVYGKHEMGNFN